MSTVSSIQPQGSKIIPDISIRERGVLNSYNSLTHTTFLYYERFVSCVSLGKVSNVCEFALERVSFYNISTGTFGWCECC